MINKGKANAVYVRARVCMYMCMCVCVREGKRQGDFDFYEEIHGQSSRISLSNYICRRWGADDGMRNPCRTYAKRKRPREVHPLSSLFRLHPEVHPLSIFLRVESDDRSPVNCEKIYERRSINF